MIWPARFGVSDLAKLVGLADRDVAPVVINPART
jgi:hypothetical protein